MHHPFADLSRLAVADQDPGASLERALDIMRGLVGAVDAYAVSGGDDGFDYTGSGEPLGLAPPALWLVHHDLTTRGRPCAFRVRSGRVVDFRPLEGRASCDYVAALIPTQRATAAILLARGVWRRGLSFGRREALETAMPALALALDRCFDRAHERREQTQLNSLVSIGRIISQADDLATTLTSIAVTVANAASVDYVSIDILGADGAVDIRCLNYDRQGTEQLQERWKRGRVRPDPVRDTVIATRQSMVFPDAQNDERISESGRSYFVRTLIRSTGVFPLLAQDDVLGVLSVASHRPLVFDQGQRELLEGMAIQVATAVKGVQVYEELCESQKRLRQSEQRFRSLVQNASDMITVIETDTTVRYQSPSVQRMLGRASDDITGTRLSDLLHPEDVATVVAYLHEMMSNSERTWAVDARLRHADGSWRHVEIVGSDQRHDAAVEGFVLNVRDVTERKMLEWQLRQQAFHDPLTKLANRARFVDRLEHAMLRATRNGTPLAVLFMDLDNFKSVNDSLGHSAGDRMLIEVSRRIAGCLRPGDTAARFGGDEFAILLEDMADLDDAPAVAERIFEELRPPVSLEGKEMFVRASIGIAAERPSSGQPGDADQLLRRADVAMYVAKRRGKGRYEVYEPRMHVSIVERLELLGDLQRAVDLHEFTLHYQPVVLLKTGDVIGVEALVRWQHPRRGLVQPDEFIPLAEESGMILPLGRWVLQEACAQARRWQVAYPTQPALTMSVNVSVKQLQHEPFVAEVAEALRASGLDASTLVLEVTEGVMMQDVPEILTRLRQIKDMGVRLAIDDFGTGYSSLRYLSQFPFDLLKIDKSFIDASTAQVNEHELTRAIVELGRTLHMEIVAEGIEQVDQLSRLLALDCELGQGFYFARPMEPALIEELLRSRARSDAA